jgi:hypothetical protein
MVIYIALPEVLNLMVLILYSSILFSAYFSSRSLRGRFKSSDLCHKVTKTRSFTTFFYSFFVPGRQAVADCHSRVLLSGIHCHNIIDSRLKRAGMTELWHFLVNLQQPEGRDWCL